METINSLIKAGADVNAKSDAGATALMEASASGNVEAVKALIAAGADVNAKDKDGYTLLWKASKANRVEIVKALIAGGADVSVKNYKGDTAISIATNLEVQGIFKRIEDEKKKKLCADLIRATKRGDVETINSLIKAGADVNASEKDGWTALMYATAMGQVQVVKALLEAGANPNARDKKGRTVLSLATRVESFAIRMELEDVLKQAITDMNSALILASYRGHIEAVKRLVQSGADVNAWGKYTNFFRLGVNDNSCHDRTALIVASMNGYAEVVRELIQAGAKLNVVDMSGYTSLMYASENGHEEVVKALILAGADVNVRNRAAKTALMLAEAKRHYSIIELFHDAGNIRSGKFSTMKGGKQDRSDLDPMIRRLERLKCKEAISELYQKRLLTLLPMIRNGADVDIVLPETKGNTALHYSCGLGSLSITRWLLEHGANPNAKTNKGVVPMECVDDDNRTAIIQLLKKHGAR